MPKKRPDPDTAVELSYSNVPYGKALIHSSEFRLATSFDLTPTAAGALHDAGNPAPQPIPGYAVADALFPPHFQPTRALLPVGGAHGRAVDGTIDIGAIELAGDAIFANGFD